MKKMQIEYPVRLQVFLAKSGIGSRRSCEKLIEQGRIKVNNRTVTEPGFKVNEDDVVYADDVLCEVSNRTYYFALHKPKGYVCTNYDPNETCYARDLIDIEDKKLLFNVGRLDKDSRGLILFTNDGNFANLVSHPSSEIEKEYIVRTSEDIKKKDMDSAWRGEVKPYSIKSYKLISKRCVRVVLTEGKNREIRNMFALMGYEVTSLQRVRIGCVLLDDLPSGMYRKLSLKEISSLKKQATENRK